MLKYKADYKTIIYMVLTTGLFAIQWYIGEVNLILYVWYLFLSVAVSTMAHNHNHISMWKNKWMNLFQDNWLTIFYGFPVFAWIPTHNTNHHVHNNREPDYTKTYRYSEKNNIFTLLTYPQVSSKFQLPAVIEHYWATRKRNKEKFMFYTMQAVVLVSWIAFWMILDWRKGLLFVVIPQQVSLFSVLLFNYIQHVHADEHSKHNHSRNIISSMNFFLFNNAYHTVHHLYPGLHWSKLPEQHAKVEHLIDPALNEKSFWWYILRQYILGPFIPSLRTKSMRLERMASEKAQQPAAA